MFLVNPRKSFQSAAFRSSLSQLVPATQKAEILPMTRTQHRTIIHSSSATVSQTLLLSQRCQSASIGPEIAVKTAQTLIATDVHSVLSGRDNVTQPRDGVYRSRVSVLSRFCKGSGGFWRSLWFTFLASRSAAELLPGCVNRLGHMTSAATRPDHERRQMMVGRMTTLPRRKNGGSVFTLQHPGPTLTG